jgi:biopolymer transport protein ExbB
MAKPLARRLLPGLALLATLLALPISAHAWWNEDWAQRTRYALDTTDKGQPIAEAVTGAPLAIRLHSGNFDFLGAKEDGSDLRVLAADDKTVLPHRLERFDAANELAVLWVTLPTLLPGSDKNLVYVYAGNTKAPVVPAAAGAADAALKLQVRFDDAGAAGLDSVAGLKASTPVTPEANALLAGGAKLTGTALVWPNSDGLKISANMPATLSLWLRADDVARGTLLDWGTLQVTLKAGKLEVRLDGSALAGGSVAAATWTHVALVLEGKRALLYVNGQEVASAAAPTPDLAGPLQVGADLRGAIDELQLANTARSAAWLTLVAASQGSEGKLVKATRETAADAGGGGDPGYMGILVKNLTVDAWAVIVILGFMFVLAIWVTATKLRYIGQSDGDNRKFLGRFRQATTELMHLDQGAKHPHSSLFRLYSAGQRELKKRRIGEPGAAPLSAASLNAVKASVDADLVRESHRLNGQMVWLTIAISGGPFLGLLGTVVGVMITFAAIAAAGDVNVNAIAPGIAAALLATVAGLAVAIPALFAYNYLASRIKNISADMQIFVDEFITRVAEEYGA